MAQRDYNVEPGKPVTDPRTTTCNCGQCVVLPPHPLVHCPKNHCHYVSRSLQRPAFCARCGYDLRAWRLRNNIPELNIQFL